MSSGLSRYFRFNSRVAAVALHDIAMAALSYEGGVALRFWLSGDPYIWLQFPEQTLLFTLVAAAVFNAMGLYRGIWHFASTHDVMAIAKAAALALLIYLPLQFWLNRLEDYPRSAVVIQYFLLCLLLAGPRLLYRAWKDGSLIVALKREVDRRVPVLLLGSGAAAESFIREMERDRSAGYRVVGILDAKETRQGRDLRGVRVLGSLDELDDLLARFATSDRPQRLILADAKPDRAAMTALLDLAAQRGMTVARLPRLTDFQRQGAASASRNLRPIDIEDLLGRPQKVLDRDAVQRLVHGRRVLITGAGGTIGSELTRQVADLAPAEIILFEQGEHALYQIDMELAERWPDLPRRALLGDVRQPDRVEQVLAETRPDILLHAAAYKHVPLTEANVEEAILTNAIGTSLLAHAALRHKVGVMVLISTDKAVNPTNVMGASKRVAEMVAQSLDVQSLDVRGLDMSAAGGTTRFVTVRFGNVLGSSGSVVPLFERQLAQGGPLTVTHPDVTRFFMTTREAVELILQAAALPAESMLAAGKIFVLDMGEPVRIQDLARQMIRLAGLRPDADIKIAFTGLRPGEKLYEEVLHQAETLVPTNQQGILLAAPRVIDAAELERALDQLAQAARQRDTARVLELLKALVPEFQHAPNGQGK
ncbi:nucleoside-diphosphate sugar epimerase/dehydratase [Ferrovibrio sp.]|uniref:polysaccharide biosynthesis protein n=1 Tax=Ferrovibrio sp. TaxID=1917215 RepID=UPI0025B884A1|nr:nucleoside-diphosphate sugar epimerase/dehydratase [Ferrovibrio sp.]